MNVVNKNKIPRFSLFLAFLAKLIIQDIVLIKMTSGTTSGFAQLFARFLTIG